MITWNRWIAEINVILKVICNETSCFSFLKNILVCFLNSFTNILNRSLSKHTLQGKHWEQCFHALWDYKTTNAHVIHTQYRPHAQAKLNNMNSNSVFVFFSLVWNFSLKLYCLFDFLFLCFVVSSHTYTPRPTQKRQRENLR